MRFPAVQAIIRIVRQRVWKGKRFAAILASTLDFSGSASTLLLLFLLRKALLAFLAVSDELPKRWNIIFHDVLIGSNQYQLLFLCLANQ